MNTPNKGHTLADEFNLPPDGFYRFIIRQEVIEKAVSKRYRREIRKSMKRKRP